MRTNPRRLAFALLLTLAPTALAPAAFAQAADPTLQAAHARFAEGVQFFDQGQYENARTSFLQAYALHKHPAVLINLATSSLKSGHTLDAARYFTRYMHDSPSLTPAQRADAEKGLAEARKKLGRLDISAAAGATVTVDGDLAGTDGSVTWDVEPGAHTVKAGADSATVSVAAGQALPVRLGNAPVAPLLLPPAPIPEGAPVDPEATPPPPAPPPPPLPSSASGPSVFTPPDSMTPFWVGVTVSAAGVATAIVFGVFRGGAQNSYNQEVTAIKSAVGPNSGGACIVPATPSIKTGCSALQDDASDFSTDTTVTNVAIVGAAVGAAFAVGWYFLAPKTSAETKTALTLVKPLVAPHVGGLSLGGTF